MVEKVLPIADCLDLKYYDGLKAQHCPTIAMELENCVPRTTDEPPSELMSFRAESPLKRLELGGKFFAQDFISKYIETKWGNELFNRTCFLRLFELYQQEKDVPSPTLSIIVDLLQEFKKTIINTKNPFRAIMIDFRNYEMPNKTIEDKRVSVAIQVFHGKITSWDN